MLRQFSYVHTRSARKNHTIKLEGSLPLLPRFGVRVNFPLRGRASPPPTAVQEQGSSVSVLTRRAMGRSSLCAECKGGAEGLLLAVIYFSEKKRY